ncbi:MAG: CopD family protein [Bacteroidia bacterium]|nr:CopD family protein [Bacteroidia bacterium]
MSIFYIKALHIIFVITWFAGLFYVVRLFIYHVEANSLKEPDRSILQKHFRLASKRLWYGITWPSAIATFIFGFWMLFGLYGWNIPEYLFLKLYFIGGLAIYHLLCGILFSQLQKNEIRYSGFQLRLWNEVATVFLVAIIFIIVLKGQGNWLSGLIGLLLFSTILVLAIKIYKKYREKKIE